MDSAQDGQMHDTDAASDAFALANHVQAIFFLLFRIMSLGASVVITQSLGASHRAAADQTARAALGASMWIGIVTAVSVAFSGDLLLKLLNAPPEVLALASLDLHILALALARDALSAAMFRP